jgi:hypothetical protein
MRYEIHAPGVRSEKVLTKKRTELGCYLSTVVVDLLDGLEGVQVINTGINTNLVHHNNTSLLGTVYNPAIDGKGSSLESLLSHSVWARLLVSRHSPQLTPRRMPTWRGKHRKW